MIKDVVENKRALRVITMLQAAMLSAGNNIALCRELMAAVPEYHSHGKGKGRPCVRSGFSMRSLRKGATSKYAPGTQGIRECRRRAPAHYRGAA